MARLRIANPPSDFRVQFAGRRANSSLLEIDSWIPSEIKAISPLVDRLMRLIEGSHCVAGEEQAVELALREALTNAVVHGNGMDVHKLAHVRCRCELGKGISLIVSDQGQGFDSNAIPDPLAAENLEAEYGRGILLMKLAMDEVRFENNGSEVHMRKASARQQRRIPGISANSAKSGVALAAAANPRRRQER
jgi:serine/threonine-protein kinase RsbW